MKTLTNILILALCSIGQANDIWIDDRSQCGQTETQCTNWVTVNTYTKDWTANDGGSCTTTYEENEKTCHVYDGCGQLQNTYTDYYTSTEGTTCEGPWEEPSEPANPVEPQPKVAEKINHPVDPVSKLWFGVSQDDLFHLNIIGNAICEMLGYEYNSSGTPKVTQIPLPTFSEFEDDPDRVRSVYRGFGLKEGQDYKITDPNLLFSSSVPEISFYFSTSLIWSNLDGRVSYPLNQSLSQSDLYLIESVTCLK